MKKVKLSIGIAAILLLLSLIVTTTTSAQFPLFEKIAEIAGTRLGDNLVEQVNTVVDEDTFGGQPGPDSFFPQECHNGICRGYVTQTLIATSSVPCSLQNPLGATTTILSFFVNITANGIAQDQVYDVATSTSDFRFGTSTPALISSKQIVGGQSHTAFWTPGFATSSDMAAQELTALHFDNTNGENPYALAPGQYVNLRVATTTAGTFSSYYAGTCGVEVLLLK